MSASTISELNKKAYVNIEAWRNRPLQGGKYPYVYVDGIYLKRNWGGEYENVAVLVAIAVNEDGYREVLGAAEGMKEDKASWVSFFQWLRGRGLEGVKLIVGDKCLGMLEAVGEVFPEAKYQRCVVHFYRSVLCCAQIQGEKCSKNAEGDPRPGEQEGIPGKGRCSGYRAEGHEVAGGRKESRGWH